jgi:hypothetical protein
VTQIDEHDHDDLPVLPMVASPDRYGRIGVTCPTMLNDGTVCGEELAYAHNVREFHPVRSWSSSEIVLGEANEIDAAEEEDPHLWCTNGHDWSVPREVRFE